MGAVIRLLNSVHREVNTMKKNILTVGIVLCVLGLLIAGAQAIRNEWNYRQIDREYEAIASAVTVQRTPAPTAAPTQAPSLPSASAEPETSAGETPPASEAGSTLTVEVAADGEYAPIAVNYEEALALYPNMKGWLYAEDTQINYPIMQSGDNSYYLTHLPNGASSIAGALYMDCGNPGDFSGRNTVIYGHNMLNGSMFGSLRHYASQTYYEAHPVLYLTAPSGEYRLEVLSGFEANVTDEVFETVNEWDDLTAYLQRCIDRCSFVTNGTAEGYEQAVVLSTCGTSAQKRFVLVCGVVPLG